MPNWTDIEYVHQCHCKADHGVRYGPEKRATQRAIWNAFYNSGPVYWSLPSTSAVSPGERIDPDQAHDLAERWAALRHRYEHATGHNRGTPQDLLLEFLKGR